MTRAAEESVAGQLERLVAASRIPGIQYTAVGADRVYFERQVGVADLATAKRVSVDTTFMASSSTKVLTAAAIMQLVEKGALNLDDALTVHYPRHPYGDQLTVRQLLVQTSGISNPLPVTWIHRISDHSGFDEESALQEVLRRNPRLRFTPGRKYAYSNISYWLLGKVVESLSGGPYAAYLRRHVFAPLGIGTAEAGFQIPDLERHATGYQTLLSVSGMLLYLMMDRSLLRETVDGRLSLQPVYMDGPAYGGLICTATAFAKFLQDMLRPEPRILSSGVRDLFLSPQTTSDGAATGMTLGWRTGQLCGTTYFGKSGGGPGFRSNVRLYPHQQIATAWLANETGVSERQMNAISDAIDRHWLV